MVAAGRTVTMLATLGGLMSNCDIRKVEEPATSTRPEVSCALTRIDTWRVTPWMLSEPGKVKVTGEPEPASPGSGTGPELVKVAVGNRSV